MSITDYVVGVLSRRYGCTWNPAGLPSRKDGIGSTIIVKLPEHLWIDLKKEAMPYSTMSAVVVRAIREDE